jgi:hypothetical protein
MSVLGQERQDDPCDFLRVLRVRVVACALDHLIAAESGW